MKWLICAVIIVALAVAWVWRERRKRKEDIPPASIVLLLAKPKPLNVRYLADLLGRVTQRVGQIRAIDPNERSTGEDANQPVGDMVLGASPHFIARVGGIAFTIHNPHSPYMQDPVKASEDFPELRLRKAVRDHKAWLSMDILDPEAAKPDAYRIVARVLSNLVDADCLALYHPPQGRLVPCDIDETVTRLQSEDPIAEVFGEMSEVPVVPIDDDPRLQAAGIDARRRFSEFETAFQNRDGTNFAVKTKISEEGNSEHIWVEVDRISEGKIEGRLANKPVDLGNLKLGSKVEFGVDQVEDWAFMRDRDVVGLFTGPVFQQIGREQSSKK